MKIPNKKVPLRFTQDTYDVSKLSLSLSLSLNDFCSDV